MEKIIQITSGKGPLECQWVVAKVLKVFLQEAAQEGISYTILSREEGDANLTVKSVTLQLKGKELAPFLKSWLGTMCWVGKSTFRKFHQRSNWYIGVFELDQLQRQTFSERDVQFQTTRSQGNGGQNVNKVNTAVRATHLPTGVSVFAQDSRSQLENKKLALARLKEKLAEMELQQLAEQAQNHWNNHTQVQRGNPVRTFKGTDLKSNYVEKSYKKKRAEAKREMNKLIMDN